MTTSQILVFLQFLSLGLLALPYQSELISIYLLIISFVTAAALALWTFTHNKIGNFNIVPEIRHNCTLITSGPYRYVRHPMYSSVILLGVGLLSWFGIWKIYVLLFLIAILHVKASREEKLWCIKDKRYLNYKKQTKIFIPFIL
jgi:protein-S-isoprenylcysteine O-methyltransferase Ste14